MECLLVSANGEYKNFSWRLDVLIIESYFAVFLYESSSLALFPLRERLEKGGAAHMQGDSIAPNFYEIKDAHWMNLNL